MYKKVSAIWSMLLSYVTFDIVGIVKWQQIVKAQNEMAESVGVKKVPSKILCYFLGGITLGIYPIIWKILLVKQQKALAEAKGVKLFIGNDILRYVCLWVELLKQYTVAENYNRLVDAYQVVEEANEEAVEA